MTIRVTVVRHGFIVTIGKSSLVDLDMDDQRIYAFSTVAELQEAIPTLLGIQKQAWDEINKRKQNEYLSTLPTPKQTAAKPAAIDSKDRSSAN